MDGLNELDEIMNGPETAPAIVSTEPTTETAEQQQARDQQGRFAGTADTTDQSAQAAIEGKQEQDHTGTVPHQALHAAREAGKADRDRADRLERELAELRGQVTALTPKQQPQEQPKPTNFYADPDKAIAERLSPIEQRFDDQRIALSRMIAVEKYGEEPIKAAAMALKDAMEANRNHPSLIALEQTSRQSMHPIGDLMSWHKQWEVQQKIGNDPDAFLTTERERIRAELMAELGISPQQAAPVAQQPSNTQAPLKLPQSLSKLPGAGNGSGAADLSDAGIFSEAMGGR